VVAERTPAAEEKRRLLLDAAVKVFARKGYHAARVGDIAKEAGVAYGLLYHYFRSKDEILETIFRETWGAMLESVRGVEDAGGPAREQVRRVASIVLRGYVRNPDLIRVLVREVTRSPHLQAEVEEIGHATDELERIVRTGQENGEFRTTLPPRLAAAIFYGALESILTGWVLGTPPEDSEEVERAIRTVVELLCDGLVTEPPAAS
jgi:TetR/AcrR family transcriptional regulator, fatty acid metabolism regulator protein